MIYLFHPLPKLSRTNNMRTNNPMHLYLLILFTLLSQIVILNGQIAVKQVKTVKTEYIERLKNAESDTLFILNFWSTSCKPCLKEMPIFDNLKNDFENRPIRVIFISLDPVKYKNTRLAEFLKLHPIQSEVWILDERDPNIFIPAINNDWSGAIPATLFLYPSLKIKQFYETEFNNETLYQLINIILG
jgi:thiol-disulfide isomerase/thioredoxin